MLRNVFVVLGITLLTMVILLRFTWGPESWRLLRTIHVPVVAASLGLVGATWVIGGFRAWVMARAVGHPVSYGSALRATLVGGMVSGLTPFTGGGGAAEALILSQAGMPYSKALATVNAAGVINQGVLLVVSLILAFSPAGLPGLPVVRTLLRWILVLYGAGLLGVLAALYRLEWFAGPVEWLLTRLERVVPRWAARLRVARMKSRRFLVQSAEAFRTVVAGRPAVIGAVGGGYLAYYLLLFLVAPLLASSLAGHVQVGLLVAAQFPLFLLAGALPTPGASGGIEAAMAAVAAPYLPRAAVGIFVAVWRILTFYPPLLAGALAAAFAVHLERSGRPASPVADLRTTRPGRATGSSRSAREPA